MQMDPATTSSITVGSVFGACMILREVLPIVLKKYQNGNGNGHSNGNGNGNSAASREALREVMQDVLCDPIKRMADSQERMETAMVEFIAFQKGRDQARGASARG